MLTAQISIKRTTRDSEPFQIEVSIQARQGITTLFGPSGSGKSSILQAIAGLLKPDAGHIEVDNQIFFDSTKQIDLPLRDRCVGYLFQDLALFPHLSIEANVAYGLHSLNKKEKHEKALQILESFGLQAMASRKPKQLSGGQQQRVALARALVINPRILLLDEPLSALDSATKRDLMAEIKRVAQNLSIPILYVTHSRDEVLALAHHVIALDRGRVIAEGEPLQVLENASNPTIARLTGVENLFVGKIMDKHLERGTMTFQIDKTLLEIPLTDQAVGEVIQVAIRAGDILLSLAEPKGLSARNRIVGKVLEVNPHEHNQLVRVESSPGVVFSVLITSSAQHELNVHPGKNIWLLIKTHACHILAGRDSY
ncbi:molybdenum ABC transporter ATP-binding protein [Candidatus Acetothermia bacterium]|nr:molybdenum ABC transporter ATP-binding protein [Candidatus Acetothermia bacterium]MBI3643294.1 molybdenum ABC transporter ATP-binding protein [Candidatus Acetothermia bacterium]